MNKLAQILGIQFPKEIEISSITNTTDKVKEGSIFFALKGTQNHGSKYIEEAFEKGAKLAIHNDKNFCSSNENIIYVKDLQSSGGEKIFRVLEAFYKINNLNNLRVIVALGKIAFDACVYFYKKNYRYLDKVFF